MTGPNPTDAEIDAGTAPAPMSFMRVGLPLARYRLTTRFDTHLELPDYAGSLLRGTFGAALRRTACMTGQPDCKTCPLWRSCPYPALFETPPRPTQFEQHFSQVPNPYVIEPPPIGTRRIAAGEALVFHMVLIGGASLRQLPLIVHAWQRALQHGLGKARVRGRLQAVDLVTQADVDACAALPVFDTATGRVLPHDTGWALPAAPAADSAATAPRQLTLHIHTPLRLQHNGHALGPAELTPRTLVAQLLRRINLMLDLHLDLRPAPFDAQALLTLAEGLRDDRSGLQWKDWTRYSARQQQEMTLGGVLGRWTLHGDLAALLPWLALGELLHLGKNATMGMGGYRLGVWPTATMS
jgi:hypothetical protein